MTLILRLLGPVQISQDNQSIQIPGYKPLALLAYLVMTGKDHTRQHLVNLLIDRADDPRAGLRYALSQLRQAIGADFIRANRQQIAFNFDADYWLDVAAFEGGQLDLYRGDFLEGLHVRDAFGFEDWAFFERERLRGVYQDGLIQQLAEAEGEGNDRMAVETAHTLLRLDNLREAWHRALMRAYARLGQRETAIAQYNVCRQVLDAELGIEPTAETIRLYERIRTGQLLRDKEATASDTASSTQPAHTPSQIDHNLPPQLTPFIGRTEELAQIVKRLKDPSCRLLTLTGPGGIGKTRLALQAAGNFIEPPASQTLFSSGIYFVNLAPISSPDSLVITVADSLNLSFYSDANLRQQLLEYLREKEMLLIFDNFEHLLEPLEKAINLATGILTIAPAVKILATSREALNLQGEWLFPVSGLHFPIDDEETSSSEEYSAVQLFAQCAWRASPDFSLATEQDCVLRICRMVEGVPLAIELAAAWLKIFPCKKIARKIEQGLDLLTTSLRNVPVRHRSMRAVFDHSWNLLSDVEKQVLRQSSVFRGGFCREAAAQVAGATFANLVMLVEKSLLHRTPAGRYQMHELLRQFAAEKLQSDHEEEQAAQHRHSHYYLTFLQQREGALTEQNQHTTPAEINAEIENIRSGWQWAIAQKNSAEIGRFLSSFWRLYEVRGWFQEGEQAFERVVIRLRQTDTMGKLNPEKELILGRAIVYQGWFYYRLGWHSQAGNLGRESLAILRRLEAQGHSGGQREKVHALHLLGIIARIQGNYAEAKQLFQEELAVCKEADNRWQMAGTYLALQVVHSELGEYPEAQQLLQEALAVCETLGGDHLLTGYILDESGKLAQRLGNYEEAKQHHQAALTVRREIGDQFGIAWSLNGLGTVAYNLGEYNEAEQLCRESLTLFSEIGNQLGIMYSLNRMGCITLARGQPQMAKDYFLKSMKIATETQVPAMALDALIGMAMFLTETGEKEQAVELLALPLHYPASWQTFKDRATHLLAELETGLPPEVVSAALERGKVRKLEDVVAEILAAED